MSINYKQKLAIFISGHGNHSFLPKIAEGWQDYARVSEYMDIDFIPLPQQVVIESQLAAIDKEENAVRTRFEQALNIFKERRANLQALTHVVEA